NRDKGEKTPWEFYSQQSNPGRWGDANNWEAIEQRTYEILPYNKAKRFCNKEKPEQSDFISRQLNDMRYISIQAGQILQNVCSNVQMLPGQLTAELRRLWGLNSILHKLEPLSQHVDVSDYDSDEKTPSWVVKDENNQIVEIYSQINQKPENKGEFCLSGKVNKKIFEINGLNYSSTTEEIPDGKYWKFLKFAENPKFYPVFRERPRINENTLVLKGSIDDKGRFFYKKLPKTILTEYPKGWYYAIFSVTNTKIFKDKKTKPQNTMDKFHLFGEIKDGIFHSWIYECKQDLEDGRYWLQLTLKKEDIRFQPVMHNEPENLSNEICIRGQIDDSGIYTNSYDKAYSIKTTENKGSVYAVFTMAEENNNFYPIYNHKPSISKGEKVVEGDIYINSKTGEVHFDPRKNREDQRHHAIDAITIALTERSFLQKLSTLNAQKADKERGLPYLKAHFPAPWPEFYQDARQEAAKILISYRQNMQVLKSISKRMVKDGKLRTSKGMALRGQLHKETVYGKRTAPDGREAYHVRIPITSIDKKGKVEKIVDKRIRKLVETHLETNCGINLSTKYSLKPEYFYKDGNWQLYLPNNKIRKDGKQGESVPIKKIRIRENLSKSKQLKQTLNQWVNPRNNHHVAIYKDNNDEFQESMVTFWEAAERLRKGEALYQMPIGAKELITTLQENDLFLIDCPFVDELKKSDSNEINYTDISSYLYRVQKISTMYYTFRYHLASSVTNPEEEYRIVSLKAWQKVNPIKVYLDISGKLLVINND
ncbi:hypothetical protein KAJ27_05770, partial [bacterium]|nr:hypothetical protein [bacterium]